MRAENGAVLARIDPPDDPWNYQFREEEDMRCPRCRLFVSHDLEAWADEAEIDRNGKLTAKITLSATCSECGEEISRMQFTDTVDTNDCGGRQIIHDTLISTFRLANPTRYGFKAVFQVGCECGFKSETTIERVIGPKEMEES